MGLRKLVNSSDYWYIDNNAYHWPNPIVSSIILNELKLKKTSEKKFPLTEFQEEWQIENIFQNVRSL